jgi:single-strand DNA-binding protein
MYLNEAQVSLTGYVATQPTARTVNSGAVNVSMRVAWTPRRQDRVTGEWADGNTSYVTVICWRRLATNAAVCLRKGDPVVVKGRLSIRNYEDKQGMQRTVVEVEASSVGHDLSRGVAKFQRVRPQTGQTAAEYAAANGIEISGLETGGAGGTGAGAVGAGVSVAGGGGSGTSVSAYGSDGQTADQRTSDGALSGPDSPVGSEDPFFDEAAPGDDVPEAELAAAPF